MPVEVHSEFLQRRFTATVCSLACLLNFIIVTGAGILPLYIAWASHSFWIREALKWEQLDVTFKSDLIVRINGMKGVSSPTPFTLTWTTSPNANDLLGGAARAPIVRTTPFDYNLDGKVDALSVKIRMPLASDEAVYGIAAAAFFESRVQTVTRLRMDSLALVQHSSPIPGSQLIANGELHFSQRDSLPFPTAGVFVPYLTEPLVDLDAAKSGSDVQLSAVVAQYSARNFTTHLSVPFPLWITEDGFAATTPGSAQDLTPLALSPRAFSLDLMIRIPPTAIRVRPGVSEELKHGWIQYLSFLAITVVLAWLLRKVIFGFRIVETHVTVDAPRSKLHLE